MKSLLFIASLLSCAAATVVSVLLAFASLTENPFKAAGLGCLFLAFAALMMLVTVLLACAYVELVRK